MTASRSQSLEKALTAFAAALERCASPYLTSEDSAHYLHILEGLAENLASTLRVAREQLASG